MGAMVEPTGVSYQGLFNRLRNWQPGNNVVIFGAGPIGLAAEALVIAAGAGQVIMFDPSASRCQIALNMGASAALDPGGIDLDAAIMQHTLGRGVDYVVECAGFADQTIERLDRCLAVNASIIDIGMGEADPTLPIVAYKAHGRTACRIAGACRRTVPAGDTHDGGGQNRHAQNGQRAPAAGRRDWRVQTIGEPRGRQDYLAAEPKLVL